MPSPSDTAPLLKVSNSHICLIILSLQLYTVDHFLKTLVIVGYATLNIFVERGTERQPIADTGMQV